MDIDLLKSINQNGTAFKTSFAKADAQSVLIFNMALPAAIFAEGMYRHDKQLKENAIFIAGGYLLSTAITMGTKIVVNRTRPFATYPFIIKRYDENSDYSFPSGHTSAAFCTATSVSLYYPKWYVIAPAYLWAASVGWARMYQGVHYPSDVLAGAVVGAGSAWLSYYIQKKLAHKNRKN
jgi:membrane-associated phospholipid phosphatase